MNQSTPRLTTTFAYYAAYITIGATMALTGPALPWLAQDTASRMDQISFIFMATSLGYLLGSLMSGKLYDRFPGHRLLAGALLFIAASAALVPVLHSLLMGLCIASAFPTVMAFAEQHVRLTGARVGWIFVGSGLGGMLVPWLVGQLFQRISPRTTMPLLLADTLCGGGLLLAMVLKVKVPRMAEFGN